MVKKRITKIVLLTVFLLLTGLLAAIIFKKISFGVPCIFYELTKLKCPGCGNTRAVIAMLELDLKQSLSYNLMALPEIMFIFYVYIVCAKSYVRSGYFRYTADVKAFDIICLAVFILWGIVRNILAL